MGNLILDELIKDNPQPLGMTELCACFKLAWLSVPESGTRIWEWYISVFPSYWSWHSTVSTSDTFPGVHLDPGQSSWFLMFTAEHGDIHNWSLHSGKRQEDCRKFYDIRREHQVSQAYIVWHCLKQNLIISIHWKKKSILEIPFRASCLESLYGIPLPTQTG